MSRDAKQQLRLHYKSLRKSLSTVDCDRWSKVMAQDLMSRLRTTNFNGTLFLYSPMFGEPDLLNHLHHLRTHIALPTSSLDGSMKFYLWHPQDQMSLGGFNIFEPHEDSIELTPQRGDVAVVPALALDHAGHRLGMGKGYYDRWLQQHHKLLSFVAGAVFPPFISDSILPIEDHDIRMDFILNF